MKAPAFGYARAGSLAEAFDLIERPGARILAGGQSLIASLNMRLSQPELLVDISRLKDLATIEARPVGVYVGALATHTQILNSEDVQERAPLLAEAAAHVAHPAIRNRGTFGGSLALADPAAEYPAVVLALNATLVLRHRRGERRVSAGHFFKGLFETDLRPGEILAGAELPKVERSVFLELARRQGDYAIIGLAGIADASGRRIAFFGAGATPVLAENASRAASLEAARAALSKDLQPPADLYHSSTTKLHLARVLLERAWTRLSKPH